MRVACLSPVPVGALRWNAPAARTTVIVKATFSLAHDGQAVLADVQEPLSVHRPLALSQAELHYASDFVPRKDAVDVLLAGHARADSPSKAIPFSFAVGSQCVSLVAVADRAATRIPLLRDRVRERSDDPASARRLAPQARTFEAWEGKTVREGFDFSLFNFAPKEHRLASLGPADRIELEHLLPGAPRRVVELGAAEAFIFAAPDGGGEPLGPGEPVASVCDTLWIDTDRALFTLTWRGEVPQPADPAAKPLVVVGLRPRAMAPSWSRVKRQLERAEWGEALREQDVPPLPPYRCEPAAERAPAAAVDDADCDPDEITLTVSRRSAASQSAPAASSEHDDERPPPSEPTAVLPAPTTAAAPPSPVGAEPQPWSRDQPSEPAAAPELAPPAEDDDHDDEEPAPVTPRAGLLLSQVQGFALGAATLSSTDAGASLPFSGEQVAEPPAPDAAGDRPDAPYGPSDQGSTVAIPAMPMPPPTSAEPPPGPVAPEPPELADQRTTALPAYVPPDSAVPFP